MPIRSREPSFRGDLTRKTYKPGSAVRRLHDGAKYVIRRLVPPAWNGGPAYIIAVPADREQTGMAEKFPVEDFGISFTR
jgi:hypothetical protein